MSEAENMAGRLEAWGGFISQGYEAPAAGSCMNEAAALIRRLAEENGDAWKDARKAEYWGSRWREDHLNAARYWKALTSIAGNTCCEGCQEAAKVARAALESKS
jgi:transposase